MWSSFAKPLHRDITQTSAFRQRRTKQKWSPLGIVCNIEKRNKPKSVWGRLKKIQTTAFRRCVSCPNLIPDSPPPKRIPCRHHSLPPRPVFYPPCLLTQMLVAPCGFTHSRAFASMPCPPKSGRSSSKKTGGPIRPCTPPPKKMTNPQRTLSFAPSSIEKPCPPKPGSASSKECGPILPCSPTSKKTSDSQSKRAYTCKCGCPCPFPCGPYTTPCGCLPPPGNVPPKCIQYMTGYYYYPYGFWFCGPYHVEGTCCPVSGCGPCGPCPCGPCGPCPKCPSPCPCCICPGIPDDAGSMTGASIPPSCTFTSNNDSVQGKGRSGISPSSPQCNKPSSADPVRATQTTRSSVSKFFPFGASISPNLGTGNLNDTKAFNAAKTTANASRSYSTPAELDQSPVYDYGYPYPSSSSNTYFFNAALPRAAIDTVQDSSLKPKSIPNVLDRDRPNVPPGTFHYSSVPNFRNPYPKPVDLDFNSRKL